MDNETHLHLAHRSDLNQGERSNTNNLDGVQEALIRAEQQRIASAERAKMFSVLRGVKQAVGTKRKRGGAPESDF